MRERTTNARLNALQAQINPHFVYNTLNIIAAKGLPIFGVDYTVTINGVYCGLKSSYGLFVLNS